MVFRYGWTETFPEYVSHCNFCSYGPYDMAADNCFGNYDDNDNNDREPARRAAAG